MIEASTIKAERARLGLSQKELSEKSGVKLSTIQRIEGGKINKTSYESVAKVADVLDISMDGEEK